MVDNLTNAFCDGNFLSMYKCMVCVCVYMRMLCAHLGRHLWGILLEPCWRVLATSWPLEDSVSSCHRWEVSQIFWPPMVASWWFALYFLPPPACHLAWAHQVRHLRRTHMQVCQISISYWCDVIVLVCKIQNVATIADMVDEGLGIISMRWVDLVFVEVQCCITQTICVWFSTTLEMRAGEKPNSILIWK